MRGELEWLQWPSINISSAESGNIESVLVCWAIFLDVFAETSFDSAGGSGDEVCQEGRIYASCSGISVPENLVSHRPAKPLEAEMGP
jgi:hypothetical protein